MSKLPEKWLIAENVAGDRTFLIHNAAPVFVAEICDEDDSPLLDGLTYSLSGGQYLGRFQWWGWPPTVMLDRWTVGEEFLALMTEADEAIQEYDRQLDVFEEVL